MGFGGISQFLAAVQGGAKLVGSRDDREYKRARTKYMNMKTDQEMDPETQKLKKDEIRSRIRARDRGPQVRPLHPAAVDALKARTDWYRLRQDQIKNQKPAPGAADDVGSYGTPPSATPGPQSALDVGDEEGMDPSLASYEDDGLEDQTQYAARGGLIAKPKKVKHYAAGGAVEPDDGEDDPADDYSDDGIDDTADDTADDPEEDTGALPVNATPTSGTAPEKTGGYSPQAAHDAALDGIRYAQRETGSMEHGAIEVSSQRRQTGQRAYLSGAGAATPDEMSAVRKKIDPEGKMSDSERNMAALAHVYEWNLKQNKPREAQQAAASMIQYFRQVSGRYQAIAAAAAEKGDIDGAMNAMLKAHANIPDGKDMKLVKRGDGSVAYSFVDTQSGKTIEKGVATPDQILQFATKGAQRNMDEFIAQASGERAGTKGKPAKEPGVPKLTDRDKANEAITTAAEGAKIDPDLADPIKHIAAQIHGQNDVSAKDALTLAGALGEAGDLKPQATAGGYTITTPDHREIKLSKDAFQNLNLLRVKAKAKLDAAAKAKAEADKRAGVRTALETERTNAGQAGVAERSAQEQAIEATMPSNTRSPESYGAIGQVRQRRADAPAGPAPVQMSEIDKINAARRSAGLPPIDPSRLPSSQAGALPVYD